MTHTDKHIVDQLIEERATQLMSRPLVWSLVRRFFYPLLGYRQAVEIIDRVAEFRGLEIFDLMSRELTMAVSTQGLDAVPKEGPAIIVANHPAGIADGIAVYDAIKDIRRDITFFANRDAIRAAPGLVDMIIPVEWLEDKRSHGRSKETVRHMVNAFRSQRLIVIFPSGRLAQPTLRGLKERPWMSSAVSLAQKYGCPILPMHIDGRSSLLYYVAYLINTELRDMTLFRELLNKQNARYHITVGEPVTPLGEPRRLTEDLHRFVTEELHRGVRRFKPAHSCEPASAPHPCSSAEPVLPSRSDAP